MSLGSDIYYTHSHVYMISKKKREENDDFFVVQKCMRYVISEIFQKVFFWEPQPQRHCHSSRRSPSCCCHFGNLLFCKLYLATPKSNITFVRFVKKILLGQLKWNPLELHSMEWTGYTGKLSIIFDRLKQISLKEARWARFLDFFHNLLVYANLRSSRTHELSLNDKAVIRLLTNNINNNSELVWR